MENKIIPIATLQAIYNAEMIKISVIEDKISSMDDENLSFLEVAETSRDLSRVTGKLDILELIINNRNII